MEKSCLPKLAPELNEYHRFADALEAELETLDDNGALDHEDEDEEALKESVKLRQSDTTAALLFLTFSRLAHLTALLYVTLQVLNKLSCKTSNGHISASELPFRQQLRFSAPIISVYWSPEEIHAFARMVRDNEALVYQHVTLHPGIQYDTMINLLHQEGIMKSQFEIGLLMRALKRKPDIDFVSYKMSYFKLFWADIYHFKRFVDDNGLFYHFPACNRPRLLDKLVHGRSGQFMDGILPREVQIAKDVLRVAMTNVLAQPKHPYNYGILTLGYLNPDLNPIWTRELLSVSGDIFRVEKGARTRLEGFDIDKLCKHFGILIAPLEEVSYPNVASHRKRNAMSNGSTSFPEPSPTSEQRASSIGQGETLLKEELGSHLTSGPVFSDLSQLETSTQKAFPKDGDQADSASKRSSPTGMDLGITCSTSYEHPGYGPESSLALEDSIVVVQEDHVPDHRASSYSTGGDELEPTPHIKP
ncbi:hypothetical protein CHU98_g5255 [Xylaria longipes]|nr:hypothetical protein CHU98_g5255 [Xylaria longipes]